MTCTRHILVLLGTTLLAACGRDSHPRTDSTQRLESRAPSDSTAPAASSSAPREAMSAQAASRLTEHGIGPVKVGMTLAEARAATAGGVSAPPAADTAVCGFATWRDGPAGLRLMTARGRIVRIDVDSGTTNTEAGASIGDSEERIARLYAGRVEITPHKYTSGHYLTIRPVSATDSAYRLIFESNGRRVTMFRAGRIPEVEFVEGCG